MTNDRNIRKSFDSFLEKNCKPSDVAPFGLVYIRLILVFKNSLTQVGLAILLEREKQLRGEEFRDEGFDILRNSRDNEFDRYISSSTSSTPKKMLEMLMSGAFIDTEENDFFYMTEPMYEFVDNMEISPDRLKHVLESEFVGLKL